MSDEWKCVDKAVQNAQSQFLEAGKPSPIAERIMENYKNQLAWSYTPAGQLVKTIMESLDSEDNNK